MPDVTSLATLAPFTDGAVVSRVLLKTKGGSATLFAFGADEGLTEHTSTSAALAVVVEGEMAFTIGGETRVATAGDAVTLPADVPHALHAATSCRMLLFLLK